MSFYVHDHKSVRKNRPKLTESFESGLLEILVI